MRKIARNSATCILCGSEIESKHRHDFVSCRCGNIAVDGGLEYLRRLGDFSGQGTTWIDTSEYRDPRPIEQAIEKISDIPEGYGPTPAQFDAAPFIDRWVFILRPQGLALTGIVSGHPSIEGGPAVTSVVIAISIDDEWAQTVNRYYKLGRQRGDRTH